MAARLGDLPALWQALLLAWLHERPGNRPDYYSDRHAADALRLGASVDDVATAAFIEPESANRKIARGRRAAEGWQAISQPAVELVPLAQALALYGLSDAALVAAEPDHPSSAATQLRALTPDWDYSQQQGAAMAAATAAIERAARRRLR